MAAGRRQVAVDGAAPIDVFDFVGPAPGPVLAVLGGVHGDEAEGVFAAHALAQPPISLMRGRLIVVPVAHPAAFEADTREAPTGGNLARMFPGDPNGTAVERTAAALTDAVLSEADMLVDLHTAGRHYDMPLMAGYIDLGDEAATQSRWMAERFGADFIWRHPSVGPGRTLSIMAAAGKPAIYSEAPGGGGLNAQTLTRYIAGVRRVMAGLDMNADESLGDVPAAQQVEGDGDLDNATVPAPRDGFFSAFVSAGASVGAGQALGRVMTLDGNADVIVAPRDGVMMYLRRTARVAAGTPLIALAGSATP